MSEQSLGVPMRNDVRTLGNTLQALESLDTALRLRLWELRWLKADPLMDSLRKEPRYQAIEQSLKSPND